MLGDRFCEACGTFLLRHGFLAVLDHECPACRAPTNGGVSGDCRACGSRWSETRTRWGLEGRLVGAVSDRGLRRFRNEDACAVAFDSDHAALVVCDGVASTDGADIAAAVAARAAIDVLRQGLQDPSIWPALVVQAAAVAQCALSVPSEEANGFQGCTTFVAALVRPGQVVVGNVGDSRAYLIGSEDSCELVTVDDSWAREAVQSGLDEEAARSSPRSHEITAWLGTGAGNTEPHVAVRQTDSDGYLVACSDGLWEYVASSKEMAALVRASGSSGPAGLAGDLVDFALSSGGADNVTVAVARTGPAGTPNSIPQTEGASQNANV